MSAGLEEAVYYVQNHRGDVVALVDAFGNPLERIRYTAYGEPQAYHPVDFQNRGEVTPDTLSDYIAYFFAPDTDAKPPGVDFNCSGALDPDDLSSFIGAFFEPPDAPPLSDPTGPVPPGVGSLSRASVDNRFGYAAYVWDNHLGLYHVRNRVYDPYHGRWLQPDPIGFAGGVNLYQYGGGDPIDGSDPMGLWWWDGDWIQYGAGGLLGAYGSEPQRAGAQGAYDGFVVGTNAAASTLTNGYAGSSKDQLAASGALYDPDNAMLNASETLGGVAGTALQTAAGGALAKAANCGTVAGRTIKAGLDAKVAYDKANSLATNIETAIEVVEMAADGDFEGAAMVAGEAVAEEVLAQASQAALKRFADGIKCFAAGTVVATPSGPQAIECIEAGQRVLTSAQGGFDGSLAAAEPIPDTEIDPSTWRLFILELGDDAAKQAGRTGRLELLRPLAWATEAAAGVDGAGVRLVRLDIEEWGLHGLARLVGMAPCPPIEKGPGRIVLMRSVTRYEGPMATVGFKQHGQGPVEAITGTYGHPIYSVDREEYVDLGDLVPGERVRTADGWAMVESLARWWGEEEVHNLEVDGDHRFFVGWVGVESHNAEPCAAAQLPKMKGNSVPHIEQQLGEAGFVKKYKPNSVNQTWNHPDGSQVRVHHMVMRTRLNTNLRITPIYISRIRTVIS